MADPLYHCPDCGSGFRGYHRCSEGTDRVAYICSDCQKVVYRTVGGLDIEGIPPQRCGGCTLNAMAADRGGRQ
jgi:DNA-directed RNA polymerase subunit RPC12/RpoP